MVISTVDYLGEKRFLPKTKSPSEDAIREAIEQKRCKTCDAYTFYFCSTLKQNCGPEGSCSCPSHYHLKPNLVVS